MGGVEIKLRAIRIQCTNLHVLHFYVYHSYTITISKLTPSPIGKTKLLLQNTVSKNKGYLEYNALVHGFGCNN